MSEPNVIADLARDIKTIADRMDGRPDCPFSAEEIERIRRAANFVEWLDMTGRLGKWAFGTGAIIIGLISQWERIKGFFGVGQ